MRLARANGLTLAEQLRQPEIETAAGLLLLDAADVEEHEALRLKALQVGDNDMLGTMRISEILMAILRRL